MDEPHKVRQTIIALTLMPAIFYGTMVMGGWSSNHLGWSDRNFYLLVAGVAIFCALLTWSLYMVPIMAGFVTGACGALFLSAWAHSHLNWTHTALVVLLVFLGAIPGFVVYGLLKALQDRLLPGIKAKHERRVRRNM